mmetsp:Transcript_7854/g.33403  ORF Transcript_7854/g.33403 Transcript_7854/m.33403 type:complete len:216 (-) Transcript_7854:1832-2479(-)
MGGKHPSTHAYTSILPSLGSTGRCAKCAPRGVKTSFGFGEFFFRAFSVSAVGDASASATAPTIFSRAVAARTASGGGGSGVEASVVSGSRSGLVSMACITRLSSGIVEISGASFVGWFAADSFDVYSRTQTPGRTRPALPFLCAAEARLHQPSFSDEICVFGSNKSFFERPLSKTATTSGIVSDVSATFVANTILMKPLGAGSNARRCSATDKRP